MIFGELINDNTYTKIHMEAKLNQSCLEHGLQGRGM